MTAKIAPDYDLVIIGNSVAAISAAFTASRNHMRVALVRETRIIATATWQQQALWQYLNLQTHSIQANSTTASQALDWSQQIAEQLAAKYAPANLIGLGIDLIEGVGEFHPQGGLRLIVEGRELRSKAYLLIELPSGRETHSVQFSDDPATNLLFTNLAHLSASPSTWLIIGGTPSACEIAAQLKQLGAQVHLATSTAQLLPLEDISVNQQVHAQLVAAGVQIHPLVQVEDWLSQPGTKISQPGMSSAPRRIKLHPIGTSLKRATELTCNVVIVLEQSPIPANWLNLSGIGVQLTPTHIPVNGFLQTNHPQIYACGDLLAGYARPELSQAEADLVCKNLCHPWQRRTMNYHSIPWTLNLFPSLTRVGLNLHQARQQDPTVRVYRQPATQNDAALLRGELVGFYELIVGYKGKGQLLGATISSNNSRELGQMFALALQQRLKLSDLEWANLDLDLA
jgi:pyruvate/2-oxoglutarate dehydrogenase complex dihydrolipoamide dehydrogenase (E3) component